jgi:hypothetical protein
VFVAIDLTYSFIVVDKYTDGLRLLQDLSEHHITFTEFLDQFRESPKAEQDRLLAAEPQHLLPNQIVLAGEQL